YRGDLLASLSKPILAVVGTRKSSSYGREMTRKLLQPLVKRGICIVSGLAIGIDTIAHQCALEQGSSTLAVLAGGVDEIYPAMNKELARRITAQGALISEYEPCTKLERWNFPARNRIVSALSQSVFVVEGTIDSGALLTAKFALEQNREILALPGNINNPNAQGPNYLIKCGARVITCPEDLLQAFDLEPETAEQMELFPELSDNEKLIYESLKQAGRELGFDELMLQCKFSFGQLSIALLNLELKNLIAKASGNSYLCL
ncbi:MAG: DNA-processing protein DprA, partial [Candidatus Cloacimonetes bacterium]|nr:DNA-processing protein DprA [Candidatus Cloacimonadota bacterium]